MDATQDLFGGLEEMITSNTASILQTVRSKAAQAAKIRAAATEKPADDAPTTDSDRERLQKLDAAFAGTPAGAQWNQELFARIQSYSANLYFATEEGKTFRTAYDKARDEYDNSRLNDYEANKDEYLRWKEQNKPTEAQGGEPVADVHESDE